jgi:hypothetical protein
MHLDKGVFSRRFESKSVHAGASVPGKLMSFRQRNKVFLRRAQQIEAILIAAVALEG